MDVDAISHFEDMRHVVRDEHDGQATTLHVENQFEHAAGLLDAKRRRGFVHDDDLGAECCGAGHSHTLALATG